MVERTGKDLREVDLLVGSGGVLRNGRDGVAGPGLRRQHRARTSRVAGSSPRAAVVVDHDYVLAAAGLLADDHPEAAYRLAVHARPVGSVACHRERPGRRAERTGRFRPGDPGRRVPGAAPADPSSLMSLIPTRPDGPWRRCGRGCAPSAASHGPRGRHRPVELQPGPGALGRRPGGRLVLAVPGHRGRRLLILWTLGHFAVITMPVVIALLIAALMTPLVRLLARIGVPRALAAILVVVGGIAGVAALLTFAGAAGRQRRRRPRRPGGPGPRPDHPWLKDGPLHASDSQINGYIDQAQTALTSGPRTGPCSAR